MSTREVIAAGFICLLIALFIVVMYVDEYQDGAGERECMSQVKEIETEAGYSPDCDL